MKTMVFGAFQGSIEVSMTDNCLHGRILGIKDLVTYEGASPAELLLNFRRAVTDYITDDIGRVEAERLIGIAVDQAAVIRLQVEAMGRSVAARAA